MSTFCTTPKFGLVTPNLVCALFAVVVDFTTISLAEIVHEWEFRTAMQPRSVLPADISATRVKAAHRGFRTALFIHMLDTCIGVTPCAFCVVVDCDEVAMQANVRLATLIAHRGVTTLPISTGLYCVKHCIFNLAHKNKRLPYIIARFLVIKMVIISSFLISSAKVILFSDLCKFLHQNSAIFVIFAAFLFVL